MKISIPARSGKAVRLRAGQVVKIINTKGQQVVDTWAFNADDVREFMSMEHSRVSLSAIIPKVGDALFTNRRRPILTLVEDNSGGIHDTLIAACDRCRYEPRLHRIPRQLHRQSGAAMARTRLDAARDAGAAQPVHEHPGHRRQPVEFRPPVSTPGSYVTLRAEMDCIVAFSACPQDMIPINGTAMRPTEAHFEIVG